jgi:hypothetical protein
VARARRKRAQLGRCKTMPGRSSGDDASYVPKEMLKPGAPGSLNSPKRGRAWESWTCEGGEALNRGRTGGRVGMGGGQPLSRRQGRRAGRVLELTGDRRGAETKNCRGAEAKRRGGVLNLEP